MGKGDKPYRGGDGKKKAGGSNGRKDASGKRTQKGGGQNPTAGDSPDSQTKAKRSRPRSTQRKGKFVETFQEVDDSHNTSDATTSHTSRVTRSQTLSESTTGSPVKGDQTSKGSPHKAATSSGHSNQGPQATTKAEREQALAAALAAIGDANVPFDSLEDVNAQASGQPDPPLTNTAKMPWSKPQKGAEAHSSALTSSSTEGTDKVVPGAWTEQDVLALSSQSGAGLTQSTAPDATAPSGSHTQTLDDEWGTGADAHSPSKEDSVDLNDIELQSEASQTPPHSEHEDGEVEEAEEGEVMDVEDVPPAPKGKKPTQTHSDKQPAHTSSDQQHSSHVSDNQRAPAPQRAKGGPGHQSRQKKAQEDLAVVRRMTQNEARDVVDRYDFIIDAHMHVMEYKGRYFKNVKEYRQWVQPFLKANLPFALGIEVQHDPAIWSAADSQSLNSPISYVRQFYGHIMPALKYPFCAVACHPKFSAPKYDQRFYGAERIKAELTKLIRDSAQSTFHGMEVIMIGEFGLEFGVSQEEKAKPFPGEVSKAQKDLFMAHVQVANETGLPIMLHIRGRTFRMQQDLERLAIRYLQEGGFTNQVPIIRHSYAGGAKVAQEWVDAFDKTYFSYGPVSRSWGQAAAGMDNFDPGLIRSLVETDCPLQERDEEENKNLPPNSPLRVPSHPDTTLKMLNHLCAARKIDLDDGARAVAAATMRAFSIGQDAIMAALTCPVVVPADSVANRDHEAAFPGHKPKFSDEGGQKQSQKGLGPKPTKQAITKQQLKSALLFAAAGGPRGTATRPNTNADDDGRDFGDATHTKSTNSNVKRSKTRRGDSPPPATGNDDVAAFPAIIKPLPTRPTTLRQDETIPLETCRQELHLDVTNRSSTGLELFKECDRIHKGECKPQTVGSQVRSLNRDVIAKIKSHTTRELAKEVAERFIPSIFHSILIHYLKHLPEDLGASKYQIMKKVLNQDVDYLLGEIEVILGQLIQRGACHPQKLSDTMVHQGVHSWTFCCRYPYNSCQHRKTVGPIRYEQTSRRELSEFGEDLLEFILHHIPDGIDHNRMHRQGDRQVLIKERIIFIGDSVAASLASRTRDRNATYVEVYTLKELAKFLNVAYFGCDVLQVIIAVGRTDMARLRVNRGVGEMRFYMEHVLIALARNFPHVRFTFVAPPYTHTQRQKWEEQVIGFCVDALEVYTKDLRQVRCLPALPRLFRSLFDRCSNAFDDAQDWMDCEGNLRWGGLTNVIRHLHTNLRVEVFELDPKADGAPLVPPSWRVADFTRGPPAEQQNAPVGKADIQYLSEDELPLRKFRMRPPGPSDEREERSPSQTGSTMSRQQTGDRPTTSRTRSSSRSSDAFDTRVSQTSVETGSETHTPDHPVLRGAQYRMPYYQVAPQTTATPPTQAAQGQPTQALGASFTAAPAPDYIPSPLHQYGYGTSYGQSTYFPSPLHQQAGVSQGQQTHQAQQPMQTNPPPGFATPQSAYIPPPPPGLGNLFRPPATFGQSMTAPQTSSAIMGQPMAPQTHTFSGNAGQPMAPQAQTVGVQGSGAGYSAFQVHPSYYSQVHALQSQPQQSQTPGSDGYHSLPHTAPASSSQTPAPQQQPQPPTSTAPIGGQYTLTPEMVEALLKAGYNIPPRQ